MSKFVITWVDGETGKEVEAYARNEEAAVHLASVMSEGADATLEFDDGVTHATWKYEDGKEVGHDISPKKYDLSNGWSAHWRFGNAITLTQGSERTFELTTEQTNLLRSILKENV